MGWMSRRLSVKRIPITLGLGAGLILGCGVLLGVDVGQRGAVVIGPAYPDPFRLAEPASALGIVARWVAFNITPLIWIAYLLLLDGVLVWQARRLDEPALAVLRRRPNRFVVAWLTGIPVWCYFDWLNFSRMHAWVYYGLPPQLSERVGGYFLAFAAITPGMLLAAQFYQSLGLRRWRVAEGRGRRWLAGAVALGTSGGPAVLAAAVRRAQPQLHADLPLGPLDAADLLLLPGALVLLATRRLGPACLALGVALSVWAVAVASPLGNLALWVGLIFLLDPVNAWLGVPSLLRDWRAGRWGRTVALMLGGATSGLLWELANYYALSKWTYKLPFLGALEHYRYFEMPWLGFPGFLPFALECWVVLNTAVAILDRLGLRVAEGLPDDDAVM
jgi:hypothetical protein